MDQLNLYRYGYTNIGKVILRAPTLDEICNYGESDFWVLADYICAIPTDYMLELDKQGIRYEDVPEYDFFIDSILPNLDSDTCNILLPNVHPEQMQYQIFEDCSDKIVVDIKEQVVIDKNTYVQLTRTIRKLFGLQYKPMFAQNDFTRKKLFELSKKRRKKAKSKPNESVLLPLVSSMVNCSDFKYNYEEVWNMNFYAFMDSVKRVNAVRSANQMYTGGYFGLSLKDVKEYLDWMRPL